MADWRKSQDYDFALSESRGITQQEPPNSFNWITIFLFLLLAIASFGWYYSISNSGLSDEQISVLISKNQALTESLRTQKAILKKLDSECIRAANQRYPKTWSDYKMCQRLGVYN